MTRSPTSSTLTRVLGIASLIGLALVTWWGLWVSPPDVVQGQLVRIIYIHPAVATLCYVGFGGCALSSLAWLWRRTRSEKWDRLAVSCAEVGLVFCGLTLVTGSIWGRAAWGVWWTWDARLTLTALLFGLYAGYLALRGAIADPSAKARVSAIFSLLSFLVVPIDHYATTWWQTLHQPDTIFQPSPLIHGWQLLTMLTSFVAFGLVFAWLLLHRYRVEGLDQRYASEGMSAALAARRSEASPSLELSSERPEASSHVLEKETVK